MALDSDTLAATLAAIDSLNTRAMPSHSLPNEILAERSIDADGLDEGELLDEVFSPSHVDDFVYKESKLFRITLLETHTHIV